MLLNKSINIAIDGFSSCGKSSYAKLIAKKLNYIYIDSGAMYRSVALYAIQKNLVNGNHVDEEALKPLLQAIKISFTRDSEGNINAILNGENVERKIRGTEVSSLVSEVSKLRSVREYLVQQQQQLGKEKCVVMDGRDIGTVVFPNAEVKIFMTAKAEIRAQRRFDELKGKGMEATYEEVLKNIKMRDENDLSREIDPLKKADDAMVLDNSEMSFEEQMEWFVNVLKEKNIL
ncbi:MAG: (d)CMP kinase [Bacteroidales bacterium]|nr:(d)CMP kinase [Bacteroidales bacterium]